MDDRDLIRAKIEEGVATRESVAKVLTISVPSLGRLLRKERTLKAGERDLAFKFLGIETGNRATPIIGRIAAGNWKAAIQEPMGFTRAFDRGGPNTFALVVDGDSMNLVCRNGSVIAVDPDDRRLVDGAYYAVINDIDDATFKQFRSEPARLEPASDNDDHTPIYIGTDTVNVIGRIVQITFCP